MILQLATILAAGAGTLLQLQAFDLTVAYDLDCYSAGVNHVNFKEGLTCTGKRKYTGLERIFTDPKTWNNDIGFQFSHSNAWQIADAELPLSCKLRPRIVTFKDGTSGQIIDGVGAWNEDHVPAELAPGKGAAGDPAASSPPLPYRTDIIAVETTFYWGDNAVITLSGWTDGLANSILCKVSVVATGTFAELALPQCTCTSPSS